MWRDTKNMRHACGSSHHEPPSEKVLLRELLMSIIAERLSPLKSLLRTVAVGCNCVQLNLVNLDKNLPATGDCVPR